MPRRTGQSTQIRNQHQLNIEIGDQIRRLREMAVEVADAQARFTTSMEARKTQLQAQAAEIDMLKAEVAQLKARVEVKP